MQTPPIQAEKVIEGLFFTAKPCGISTHSPGDGKPGFVESLSAKLSLNFKVVHRLDKETSGALILGVEDLATKTICKLFEEHKVEKRYLFITDKPKRKESSITYKSHIQKRRGRFVSWPNHEDLNSETTFNLIKSSGKYSLWEALPKSGKPHQIRLHAKDLGINILGDKDHAGSKFSRLMLHAHSVSFEWNGKTILHKVEMDDEFLKLLE